MYEEMKHQVMAIYERHYHDVYQFLLYFAGSQNDAEDLTQEVFLRMIRSRAGIDRCNQGAATALPHGCHSAWH